MNYKFSEKISFVIYEDFTFIFDHKSQNEYKLNNAAGKIIRKIENQTTDFTAEEIEFINELQKLGVITSEQQLTPLPKNIDNQPDQNSVFDDLNKYAAKNLIPASATFELTYKCGLNCIHCYVDKTEKREQELSTEKIKDFIKEFKDLGGAYITFTGGDPFFKKDFEEIFNFAREKRIAVSIMSPCWNTDNEMLKRIAEKGIFTFQISFYGHNAEIHDKFTTQKGSFEKTLSAARLLRELGVIVYAAVTVSTENIKYFDEITSFLKKEKFQYHFNFNIFKKRNGDRSPEKLNISETELKEALFKLKLPNRGRLFNLKPDEPPCNAAHSIFAVDPFGNLYPCLEIREKAGSLKENSLKEIWKNSKTLNTIRNLKFSDLTDCPDCKFKNSCNRCAGTALKENLTIKDHSKFDCKYAKALYELD